MIGLTNIFLDCASDKSGKAVRFLLSLLLLDVLEGETRVPVSLKDLADGVDVGRRPEVEAKVVVDGRVHDGPCCPLHGVVQTRVHNVLLRGTRHSTLKLRRWLHVNPASNPTKPALQGVLNRLQKVVVGLALVLKGQPSIRDMVKVLEPLKIGHSDTTSINVHVRDDQAAVLPQNLFD